MVQRKLRHRYMVTSKRLQRVREDQSHYDPRPIAPSGSSFSALHSGHGAGSADVVHERPGRIGQDGGRSMGAHGEGGGGGLFLALFGFLFFVRVVGGLVQDVHDDDEEEEEEEDERALSFRPNIFLVNVSLG